MTAPSAHGIGEEDRMLRELLRTDPVASLLLAKWRLPYPVIAAICLALLVLLLIVLPLRWFRVPYQRPEMFFNTLSGVMMIVAWLVFLPVVWGFYAWQPPAIVRLHTRLRECLGAAGAKAEVKLSPWYSHPAWPIAGALLGLWEFRRFMSPEHEFTNAGPWVFHSNWAIRAGFVLLASMTYYMIVMLFVRQFITTISVNRIFNRVVVPVRFLHPDECGGFRFLGEHALGIAPLIAAAGLNLSLVFVRLINGGPLGSDTTIYTLPALTLIYLGGSILFFTAPLWSAHMEMVRARDAWLDDIARGFEQQQAVVQEQMRNGNPDAESVAKLETAKKAWEIGRSLPTWPLHGRSTRRFTTAVLSPLLPIGMAVLGKWLGLK
ncbi:MAG: hypothetical protein ACJ8BF_02980 [Gemmatimonadales bacterium]